MNPIPQVLVASTTERKTEADRFGAVLRGAAAGAASGLASTVALAAPFVPGAAVLAGAIRGAAVASAPPLGSALPSASGVGAGGDLLEATRTLQADAQSFSLQYLGLQESMQRESREFTALTNVMKVRHDTAKAAIANIH